MNKRIGKVSRETGETNIELLINLDGEGKANIDTGLGFFDHMLNLFAFQSGVDIEIKAKGDLNVCDHHLVEDIGIALGTAFKMALGDKKGINRYGSAFVPMDEALVFIALDFSGRAYLVYEGEYRREKIGDFSVEMVEEFLRAFAFNGGITLHGKIHYGKNDHHKIEGLFKALGRAVREGININNNRIPSTKGVLE